MRHPNISAHKAALEGRGRGERELEVMGVDQEPLRYINLPKPSRAFLFPFIEAVFLNEI